MLSLVSFSSHILIVLSADARSEAKPGRNLLSDGRANVCSNARGDSHGFRTERSISSVSHSGLMSWAAERRDVMWAGVKAVTGPSYLILTGAVLLVSRREMIT